ncbi:MAG TPA: DUF4175 family protein [Gemmatimonadaceae bacterium]|nr:DUF4175 family protein [Gemmatimonadaceae bacterium]
MIGRPARSPRTDDLQSVIRAVRRRWRLRVALHGAAIAVAIVLALLIAGALGVERFRYDPAAIIAARVLVALALVIAVAWLLAWPLMRRLPDDQVALYLEEHEPSLEMAVLSAVEQRAGRVDAGARDSGLAAQLEKSARDRSRAVEGGARVERTPIQRAGVTLGVAVLIGAILLGAGPEWLRRGTVVLLTPWRSAEAAMPFSIGVQPGNATIAKGGDQEIAAQLRGFLTSDVTLAVRRGLEGSWERIPMDAAADSATFGVRLFDLTEATTYYIEANGVRSGVFRIDVVALPYVDRIDLEYRFPTYTGRAPEHVEGGGDIAALRGTTVRLTATPTMPSAEGRIIVDGRDTLPIAPGDSAALAGDIVVRDPGTYRLELRAADGRWVTASLDYTIDVLEDEAPTVRVTRPGRDEQVTSIEEVFIEAESNDDYGVRTMELVYTVNGGEPQVAPLVRGGRRASTTAGHTLFLEEMSLAPGDLIAYHVRATDGAPGRTEPARSDIYFLNVRPFGRDYRQAEAGGGGGGGGGETSPQGLSRQQREIVAATFNVIRDRPQQTAEVFGEAVTTVALSQGRLREQVATLVRRLGERGAMGMDSTFRQIAIALAKAADEMEAAERSLGERKPDDALPPEQRALRALQQAEAQYRDVQVAMGGQQQGGGGGGGAAEDLADLFELETDKLRNQYETVQRSQQRQADEQVDEVAERLRRLAARQQQANDRQQRSFGQQGGSGGDGSAQRALADEAEEMARQLERLARERRTPELEDAARRLRESAAAMRRSAAGGQQGSAESGAQALDRLRDARRQLEETRSNRLRRDMEGVRRSAERLAEEERQIAQELEGVAGAGGAERQERLRRLSERKDEQARSVDELTADLDRLSREGRREQPEAARKMQEAAQGMRDDRLRDRIAYSRGIMGGNSPEYVRSFEEQIGASIDRARQRIAEAERAIGEPEGARQSRALEQARGLVRSMEALGDRLQGEQRGAGERQGDEQGQGQAGQQGEGARGQGQGEGQGQQGEAARGQGQGQGQQGGQAGEGGQQQAAGGMPGGSGQGAPAGGRGGRLAPDDARQLQGAYRQRRLDAEALRQELRQSGADVATLEQWIQRLRELERGRSFDDAEELARLHAAVVEGLKAYEFALRRALETGDDRPLLEASGEVPPGFKALVEEYYKSLARPR